MKNGNAKERLTGILLAALAVVVRTLIDCFLARDGTVVCSACGSRIPKDENSGDESKPLCRRCHDRHSTECIRCGVPLRQEEAYYSPDDPDHEEALCHSCYTHLFGE